MEFRWLLQHLNDPMVDIFLAAWLSISCGLPLVVLRILHLSIRAAVEQEKESKGLEGK